MSGRTLKIRESGRRLENCSAGVTNHKSRIAKRKAWKRHGVSDIIGNLLILAMTVVLFSSIFYFVANMDTPTATTDADFSAVLNFRTGEYCDIAIDHMGGVALSHAATRIYVLTNESHTGLNITDGGISTMWTIGSTWHYNTTTVGHLLNLTYSSVLEVMIVDIETNNIVWKSVLLDGSSGNSQPIIRDRYLGEAPLFIRSSYFDNKDNVSLFAWVTDAGGDLNRTGSVIADVSDLGGPSKLVLKDNNQDNWFSERFRILVSESGIYYITITATDAGDRTYTSVFSVTVTVSTSTNTSYYYNHEYYNGGANGTMPGNLYVNQMQGMGIFSYDDWVVNEYNANQTTHFDVDEEGVVVVASKFLLNIANSNRLFIIDATTKEIVADASSDAVVFKAYDYYLGYYIYTANIKTSALEDGGIYIVNVDLKDTNLPTNNAFYASQTITVGSASDSIVETYSDPGYTTKCSNFTSSETIYVKITVMNGGVWNQTAGVVQITDYAMDYPVKRIPGQLPLSSNPVSAVNSVSSTVFTFSINLSKANQDPWIPGENCYMLQYDVFKAGAYSYFLSTVVNITAPKIVLDLVTGLSAPDIGWAEGSLIDYYENDNQWVPPDYLVAYPGKHTVGYERVNLIRLGDLDNDGKNDVIAVLDDYYVMAYWNDGGWTPESIDELTGSARGAITSIEVGYIDVDNNLDIVIGYSNGEVGYFRNDGVWTYNKISSTSGNPVRAIAAVDLYNTAATQTVATSMSVVVGYTTNGVTLWKNNDRQGTSWLPNSFSGGIPSYAPHPALSETEVTSYIASGTYASTVSGSGTEQITEVSQIVKMAEYPSGIAGGNFDVSATGTREVSFLWNKLPSTPFVTVHLIGNVTWDKKVTGTTTVSVLNGTTTVLSQTYTSTATAMTAGVSSISMNLTADLKTITDLESVTVSITDAASNTVHFSDLHIRVIYTGSNQVLQHTYTFKPGLVSISSTFELDAYTSGAAGHDGFIAEYSMDGTTWFRLTDLLVNYSVSQHYSALINQATTATSTIYIRFTDTIRTDDIQNDSLYITHMYVYSKSVSVDPIGTVMDVAVADMNKDGWEDVVVADTTNVWVLLNKDGQWDGNGVKKITTSSAPLTNIKAIGLGTFQGTSKYMDVAVATSSAVYLINQTSLGSYASPSKAFTVAVNYQSIGEVCFAVGDVQGDGYADIVLSVDSRTYLYINEMGAGTFSKMQVDAAGEKINSIYLGKVQAG